MDNDGGYDLSPGRFGAAFQAFMEAVVREARPVEDPLRQRIMAHLDLDAGGLSVVSEEFEIYDHPNVQVAIEAYLAHEDRTFELLGVNGEQRNYSLIGLGDIVGDPEARMGPRLHTGPVEYVNYHLEGDAVLPAVKCGLYLISEGTRRLAVFIAVPPEMGGPRTRLRVEALAADPEDAAAFLRELIALMSARNIYKGKVISLSPGHLGLGPQTLVAFHSIPKVERSDVILEEETLRRIERHTIAFAEHAEELVRTGQSLKRGVLLYGPPGTGKTLTLMYLIGQLEGRTAILTTGLGMGFLQPVTQLARILAPAMVILEDVDLIAEERSRPMMGASPLLFELLNELDGLADDTDVIFMLTTNRPEVLEPALAARPGRIDLAVELPLPDEEARRRLFDRYSRGIDLRDVDLAALVERTEGASPAYIKELLRRAVLLATIDDAPHVGREHVETALEELSESGNLARRILGFAAYDTDDEDEVVPRVTGFPTLPPELPE